MTISPVMLSRMTTAAMVATLISVSVVSFSRPRSERKALRKKG